MDTEKLDNFSKILLATQTINYLSGCLDRVTLSLAPIKDDSVIELRERNEKMLKSMAEKTADLCNELGDFMNAIDCVCPIDERIVKPAMDIINGADDVNG